MIFAAVGRVHSCQAGWLPEELLGSWQTAHPPDLMELLGVLTPGCLLSVAFGIPTAVL